MENEELGNAELYRVNILFPLTAYMRCTVAEPA